MKRIGLAPAAVAVIVGLLAAPGDAQEAATVRVTRVAVVLESPRGDSMRVASVDPGTVLEVLGRQGNWLLVTAQAAQTGNTTWERGWIHVGSVELASGSLTRPDQQRQGRVHIRAFGHGGGTLFTAHESFDALTGRSFGSVYGAGGQVVFPSGAFAQVSLDRHRETASRVLVSGTQFFTLDTPTEITVRPILGTVGFRSYASPRYAPYVGAGVGWHVLTEESPSLVSAERISQGKLGYHFLGGVEIPVGRWLALAGEAQWTAVPKALGETGVSAAFAEDNLGGTTFRFKLILGY